MFNFLKIFKKHSGLKVGDIYAVPLDGEAARHGFQEYEKIEYFHKVIAVNDNGLMITTYLARPYENLPAGYEFDRAVFRSHESLIWQFKHKQSFRPSEKITKEFNEIVKKKG